MEPKSILEEAQAKAISAQAEFARIERLSAKYPQLAQHTGRWDKRMLCAPEVNGLVDKFEWRHNCGCCADSPLEVWPYLEDGGARVYSKPASFVVGERFGEGDRSHFGWDKALRKVGIRQELIAEIARFLEGRRERAGNDTDDDEEE
jgi:hypothetical protein